MGCLVCERAPVSITNHQVEYPKAVKSFRSEVAGDTGDAIIAKNFDSSTSAVTTLKAQRHDGNAKALGHIPDFNFQRAMCDMRRAAIQRGMVAVLDVGTSKIACLVLRFDGSDRLTVSDGIGAATTRSRGVRIGEISAMQETERAIRTAVQAAQKMAKIRVEHVIACFAGAEPRSCGAGGT